MQPVVLFIIFITVAVATVYTASKLAIFADAVKEKSKATTAFMGILVGIAISLPELTSSLTAVIIDQPDIAVGNLIGSNLFNLTGLALFDIVYRRYQIMTYATTESKQYAWLVVVMTIVVIIGLRLDLPAHFFHVSYTSLALILLYFLVGHFIKENTKKKSAGKLQQKQNYEHYTYPQVLVRFIAAGIAIMIIGSILTITAEEISKVTGIGETFVGTFLVAISTSLPDAVSVGTALRMHNFNLGISSLIGSNAFNLMILAVTDIFYLKGNLLYESNPANYVTGGASIAFVLLLIFGMGRKQQRFTVSYLFPSVLMLVMYAVTMYVVFQMN